MVFRLILSHNKFYKKCDIIYIRRKANRYSSSSKRSFTDVLSASAISRRVSKVGERCPFSIRLIAENETPDFFSSLRSVYPL